MLRSSSRVLSALLLGGVLLGCSATLQADNQTEALCEDANAFLGASLAMTSRVAADTFNDWRSGERLAGCRITASGVSPLSPREQAEYFYEQLRAAGWTRTPDPRDAPNEGSLRFRMREADCLFNVYQGMVLFTEDEIEVSNAVMPGPGETRFGVFAMCMPVMEASPRG